MNEKSDFDTYTFFNSSQGDFTGGHTYHFFDKI